MDLDGMSFVKRGSALVPADWRAEEWIAKLKPNAEVLISGRRPRNPKHHRLLFALLKVATDNAPEGSPWKTTDALLDALKLATGLSTPVQSFVTGEIHFVPKSISFAAMDQDAFAAWFEIAVDILANDLLGTAPGELRREIIDIAEGRNQK